MVKFWVPVCSVGFSKALTSAQGKHRICSYGEVNDFLEEDDRWDGMSRGRIARSRMEKLGEWQGLRRFSGVMADFLTRVII